MDFKIEISCGKCSCTFELRPQENSCKSISCPNCNAKVPEEIASHILNGLHELHSVPDTYPEDSFIGDTQFRFEVKPYSIYHSLYSQRE